MSKKENGKLVCVIGEGYAKIYSTAFCYMLEYEAHENRYYFVDIEDCLRDILRSKMDRRVTAKEKQEMADIINSVDQAFIWFKKEVKTLLKNNPKLIAKLNAR